MTEPDFTPTPEPDYIESGYDPFDRAAEFAHEDLFLKSVAGIIVLMMVSDTKPQDIRDQDMMQRLMMDGRLKKWNAKQLIQEWHAYWQLTIFDQSSGEGSCWWPLRNLRGDKKKQLAFECAMRLYDPNPQAGQDFGMEQTLRFNEISRVLELPD